MLTRDIQSLHRSDPVEFEVFDATELVSTISVFKEYAFRAGFNTEALVEARRLADMEMESDLSMAVKKLREEIEKAKVLMKKEYTRESKKQIRRIILRNPIAYLYGKYKLRNSG